MSARCCAPTPRRERDVLQLMAEGLSNRAIAERMDRPMQYREVNVEHLRKARLPETDGKSRLVLAVLSYLHA